jgi:hypothetical protein
LKITKLEIASETAHQVYAQKFLFETKQGDRVDCCNEQSILARNFKHLLTALYHRVTMDDPVGPAPLAPGMPPVTPLSSTYLEYYQDDGNDKASGEYAAIMNTFVVPVAGATLTPVQVSDAVFASAVVDPQAFIMLIVDETHPNGRVCLFHRLQQYAPQLGSPTAFDRNGYAFFGDVTNGQSPPSIEWPANAFYQVGVSVRVCERAIIDQAFAGNPETQLLGPHDNDEAGTEVIRVRQAMLVPFRYVRILLPGPLTPREAWVQLAGAIYNDGKQEACAPLLDWLRVALTRQAAGTASRLQQAHPRVPLLLPELIQRRWQLVLNDLPALSGGATLAAGHAIASSLNALVSDNRENRNADELRRAQDSARTPEKCFGRTGVLKLLRLCQVANSSELPEMWLQFAREPRRQDGIVTVQQAFNSTAQSLGLFGVHIPITPDIVAKIRAIALEMSNENDLTTGIHPFTFAYMDSSEIADAYAQAEHYKMLHDDQGAPTLKDAIVLATPGRVKLPKSPTEAQIYFQNFRVALHVLLGGTHALTQAYDMFWRRWSTSQQYLLGVYTQSPGMFPTLVVRWVQLRVSLWFGQQALENAPLEVPNFAELLNQIQLHMPWEPTLPAHYYNSAAAPATKSVTVASPPAAQVTTTTITKPGATAAVEPPPTIRARGTIVRKITEINPSFKRFVEKNLRVRDVLQRAGPTNRIPTNAEGIEMCLSYHLKGVCNTNCSRNGDHKEHSADEDAKIVRWCDTHYKAE